MTDYIVALVTAPNEEEAVRIAKDLVGSGLAACANIVGSVRSIYRWQGRVEDEAEVLMVFKTRKTLFGKLRDRVKEIHPYSVPEIIALPVAEGSEDYLRWLETETLRD